MDTEATSKNTLVSFDALTGETIVRELTDQEVLDIEPSREEETIPE
jgi:hypothetical protein